MRVRGIAIQQVLLGAALLLALLWNLARAAEISQLRLETGPTGTRAELRLDGVADYQVLHLANPDRLVLDLPGSALRRGIALPQPAGVVRGIRSGQPSPGVTRIVFDLASPVVALKPRVETGAGGPRLVLEWPDDGPAPATTMPATTVAASTTAATTAVNNAITSKKPAYMKKTITVTVTFSKPSNFKDGDITVATAYDLPPLTPLTSFLVPSGVYHIVSTYTMKVG